MPIGDVIAIWQNRSLTPDWLRWIGAAVGSTGILLFFLSVTTMGDSWRAGVSAGEKTSLVTRGVYSISRNPAFLAFDLAYLGLLLMFFRWWLLALSLFAMVMLHLQIVLVEEPFLPKVFGADYEAYRSRVCRYLGCRRA